VRFTPLHRGGSGSPLLCVHGFMDTWRTWELVLPQLEASHDVLAPTLPGHAGGPPAERGFTWQDATDMLERVMDEAGFERAHLVGNSLGGFLALQLAARDRADSVVALAPAGGWNAAGRVLDDVLELQRAIHDAVRHVDADAVASTPKGRRRATRNLTERWEHIPAELVAHEIRSAASEPLAWMIEDGPSQDWSVAAERITCPVRIVWGTADKLLPWPAAAARYREEWLPHADWVVLDGVGHAPQLDVPLETAQLVLGFTD
jgi:pimeloyl-ACP methyl ester carboxylesterase